MTRKMKNELTGSNPRQTVWHSTSKQVRSHVKVSTMCYVDDFSFWWTAYVVERNYESIFHAGYSG